ncbi:MAG: hypothetical protein ACKPKO_20430, partial [Candidatus Fonsibacter sp.]
DLHEFVASMTNVVEEALSRKQEERTGTTSSGDLQPLLQVSNMPLSSRACSASRTPDKSPLLVTLGKLQQVRLPVDVHDLPLGMRLSGVPLATAIAPFASRSGARPVVDREHGAWQS